MNKPTPNPVMPRGRNCLLKLFLQGGRTYPMKRLIFSIETPKFKALIFSPNSPIQENQPFSVLDLSDPQLTATALLFRPLISFSISGSIFEGASSFPLLCILGYFYVAWDLMCFDSSSWLAISPRFRVLFDLGMLLIAWICF